MSIDVFYLANYNLLLVNIEVSFDESAVSKAMPALLR